MTITEILSELKRLGVSISVKNGKLLLDDPDGHLTQDLLSEMTAKKELLIDLIESKTSKRKKVIQNIEEQEHYALSHAQKRLWVVDRLNEPNSTYNVSKTYDLENIDVAHMESAFLTLIDRHESLRTIFPEINGEGRQLVLDCKKINFKVKIYDFIAKNLTMSELDRLVGNEVARPFDLTSGPLIRVSLIMNSLTSYRLILVVHHIIFDGWSMSVLLNEVMALYNAFCDSQNHHLTPLSVQYKDYSAWQNQALLSEMVESSAYWKRQFNDEIPTLNIQTDFKRPRTKTFNGASSKLVLDSETSKKLKTLCIDQQTTLFGGILASVSAILSRYTGQHDLILGTPVAGRDHFSLESQIGCYVNMLPLRIHVDVSNGFKSLLKQIHTVISEAFTHQAYPFDKLVEDLGIQQSPDRSPLFDVAVVFQNTNVTTVQDDDSNDLKITTLASEIDNSKFDMLWFFGEDSDNLILALNYNTDLFKSTTIERILNHYRSLLQVMVQKLSSPIKDINYLDDIEKATLNNAFAMGKSLQPGSRSLIDCFDEVTDFSAASIAIFDDEKSTTYNQLKIQSDNLARYLTNTLHIKQGDRVGIMMGRGEELITSILAIIKVGAIYVPIDLEYPEERISWIIEDARIQLILTKSDTDNKQIQIQSQCFDVSEIWEMMKNHNHKFITPALTLDQPVYIMYTSGSTGKPKGVLVNHRSLLNYIVWANEYYFNNGKGHSFAFFTSIAFDLTNTSVFTTLLRGDRVKVFKDKHHISEVLVDIFKEESGVDVVKLTPSHITILNYLPLKKSTVKKVIVGGEALSMGQVQTLKRLNPTIQIYNEYGPTEATIGCTVSEIDLQDNITVGRPINNVTIRILDNASKLVPQGVCGELCVGGECISQGYVNAPEKTHEKFFKDPYDSTKILYKTGDIALWTPDGQIKLAGRNDSQIKIRGYRVELEEIEREINKVDAIVQNIVDLKNFSDPSELREKEEYCIRCGIPTNYPGLKMDIDGVCSICHDYDNNKDKINRYFRTEHELTDIFEDAKKNGKGKYDCLVLYSGGKDSTYVLCKLVNDYKLNVLTYTLDNGFISDDAKSNIDKTITKLGVDHIYGKTSHMNEIFVDSLKRYKNVCDGCYKTLYTLSLNLAEEMGISCIVTGLSRGQLFETRLHHLFKSDVFDPDRVDQQIKDARWTYHQFEDASTTLLNTEIFNDQTLLDRIQIVDFYRYTSVSLDEVYEYIGKVASWERPSDTGRSTNCLINELGIYVHRRERKHHNYALPYSWDVRLGHKTRQEAIAELNDNLEIKSINEKLVDIGYQDYLKEESLDNLLVCYYVTSKSIDVEEIKRSIREQLTDYMVPQLFVKMDQLPINAHGKVDRSKLPVGLDLKELNKVEYVAPTTKVEEKLAEFWIEALKLTNIGVDDNFFELGGTSIKIIILHSLIQSEYPGAIRAGQLFDYNTIKKQADLIEQSMDLAPSDDEDPIEMVQF